MPNVFSRMDLVFRPDNLNETVRHTMNLLISGNHSIYLMTFHAGSHVSDHCILGYYRNQNFTLT